MSELRERDRRQTFLSIHTVLTDRGREPVGAAELEI
jgi:hypothetical protein